MKRGKHPNSLKALVPTQFPPNTSGNPGGLPKTKPITSAMRMLLDGDLDGFAKVPKPTRMIVGRWYGQAWSSPYGMATLLERIEGRVPQPIEHKEMPKVAFILQPIMAAGAPAGNTTEGSPLSGAREVESRIVPSKNGHKPQVEEVEAVPVDDEDEEEEQD